MNNTCDILIIGSGMVGTLVSYLLKDEDKNIILIEKNSEDDNLSATSKSTGKISYLQKDIYQKLYKYFGYDKSKLYFDSQKIAMKDLVNIINKEKIDCSLRQVDTYLFATNENDIVKVKEEKRLLESFGVKCINSNNLPIPYPSLYSFYVKDNYIFNPSEFLRELKKSIKKTINIKYNELVISIEKNKKSYNVKTNKGNIKAQKIIVATHYPFFIIKDLVPLRCHVTQEYISEGKNNSDLEFSAIDVGTKTKSIRYEKTRIMYINDSFKTTSKKENDNYKNENNKKFKELFGINPERAYMNQDLMTNDYLPIVGSINEKDKNIMIATGFNGWGMTNSMIASTILTDKIKNKKNKFEDLFKVKRTSLIGTLNIAVNGFLEAKAYLLNIFYQPRRVYKVKMNDKNYYVYVDENHKRHYIETKCPHMKCSLIFNKEECSYDCPCHGSRFDIDGNLIESPSRKDIGE